MCAGCTAIAASCISALLVTGATHDEYRWLAWIALLPLFIAPSRQYLRWTLFAVLMNCVLLLPYQQALKLELVSPLRSAMVYLGLVVATIFPYRVLDFIEARWLQHGLVGRLRLPILALAVSLIWLATDSFLGTKYWYALALDPAPLWLVRIFGEEGLVVVMIGSSLALALASRLTGLRRFVGLVAVTGVIGWLCLGNPLAGATRAWPAIQVVGIQPGPYQQSTDEPRHLLAGIAIARASGWGNGMLLFPELKGLHLTQQSRSLEVFLKASRHYETEILLNGAHQTSDPNAFERSSSIIRNGTLIERAVPKRYLIPYYESMRGPQGRHWIAGGPDVPRTLEGQGVRIAPLLCFEVFMRSALRGVATDPELVVVSADTSAFGHPAINRYLIHAAAFQSQTVNAPVVLVNSAGPSGVAFPDGSRVIALRRGEVGVFRVAPDGSVTALPLPNSM